MFGKTTIGTGTVKRIIRGTIGAALVSVACFVSQAGAALLYENPVKLAGDTGNCFFTTGCLGFDSFGATEFTLASASTVGSVSFTALNTIGDPTLLTGVDWKIYSDDAGGGLVPGSLIASGDNFQYVPGPAQAGQSFTHYEYTVDIPDLALASGTFWLAFRVLSPNFRYYWSLVQNTVPSAKSSDSGATWTAGYQGLAGVAIALYDADDINIPERGTIALFGFGLAGLGMLRRRRAA